MTDTDLMCESSENYNFVEQKILVHISTDNHRTSDWNIGVRRDLFYLLDYVTRRSEKLEFPKKKKKTDFASYPKENTCFPCH